MDPILLSVFGAIAVVALGFAWKREPARAAAPNTSPEKPSQAKTVAPKAQQQAPSSNAGNAKATKRSNNASAQPAPAEPIVPNMADDGDLDITVIKAVSIAELTENSPAAARAEDAERTGPTGKRKGSRVEITYEDEADLEEVTAPVARILISAAGDSDRGLKRQRNEDSFLVFPERSLFAVADGMGGYHGGEVASTLAIDTLRHAFDTGTFEGKIECDSPIPRRGRELACAMQMGNQAIRSMAQMDPELSQMGTTLVAARFSPNKQRVYIGHVGDSRCYRLRGNVLRQLTTDHTLSALGVKGAHSKELFQAMGIRPSVTIDLIVDKPHDDDIYLLCSDGLSKMVSDEQIRSVLLSEADLEAALYGLIECANDRGGRDNTTLILIKVVSRVPADLSPLS